MRRAVWNGPQVWRVVAAFVVGVLFAGMIVSQTHAVGQDQDALSDAERSAAENHITEPALRAHIRYLSDDLLEGRDPGSKGDQLAQKYIAEREIVEPNATGLDAQCAAQIDAIVARGIDEGQMPGCVVAVGRSQGPLLLKAYGHRQIEPGEIEMTTDTVFDLASLTKPIATATSMMLLIERGDLKLDDPVSKHIPEFAQNGKDEITVLQLLTHQGGLIADNALSDYADGREQAMKHIFALPLKAQPGTKFIYSDVGFIVLGELVKRITDVNLHEFTHEQFFAPLGMQETGFLPREELRLRSAATEQRDGHWMQGEVHDPRAYALGGIAGHAGLFSTAEDLALYAQMLLQQGRSSDDRILRGETIDIMTAAYKVSSGTRGLGWDKRTGYSSNRGETFSDKAFGHGGFTGTLLWIDPELDLYVIFLSNRLHPDGKGNVNPLAGSIGTVVAEYIK